MPAADSPPSTRRPSTNLEEKGIETLFAAVGLATWEVDSGTPHRTRLWSSCLFMSKPQGAAARDYKIEVGG